MGNRTTPPRSFNTVKHSNRKERLARKSRARMTLLSICIIILAIMLTGAVFIFCSLADELNNRKEKENLGSETETSAPNDSEGKILYSQITQANTKIHEGELILVNEDHAYVFPNAQNGLVNIYDNRSKINGENIYQLAFNTYQLQKNAFDAFDVMLMKYYGLSEDNSTIITSSYRTYEDQQALGSSIMPGYSDHHTGYCVALQKMSMSASGNRERLESDHWIYQNCHKYGYIVRYPSAKTDKTGVSDYTYCFRYVGIPHATYITENALCLEEYIDLLKTEYAGEKHLSVTDTDGKRYEIYYVAAGNGELTTIDVPSNYSYTISGDNVGGFIVTVKLDAAGA